MNKSKVKIFCFYHKSSTVFKTDVIEPMQNGANNSKYILDMIKDNTGDHISDKNLNYGELTGQYWVWKNYLKENADVEYIGFCHYRRFLDFSKKAKGKACFSNQIYESDFLNYIQDYTEDKIYPIIKDYDVILPEQHFLSEDTIYNQFVQEHSANEMEILIDIIKNDYPEYVDVMNNFLYKGNFGYFCLNFVMKKSFFEEYMEWVFDLASKIEARADLSVFKEYKNIRMLAFLIERFFNVWLRYKIEIAQLKILERKSLLLKSEKFAICKTLVSNYKKKKVITFFGNKLKIIRYKFGEYKYLKINNLKYKYKP